MFLLIGVLVKNSWLAIHVLGIKPLTHVAYNPGTNQYGALSSLFGTFLTTIIAMVIAVPLALAIALLLVELVHPVVSRVVGTTIEMLAAVPSIIFGMWGIFVVVARSWATTSSPGSSRRRSAGCRSSPARRSASTSSRPASC